MSSPSLCPWTLLQRQCIDEEAENKSWPCHFCNAQPYSSTDRGLSYVAVRPLGPKEMDRPAPGTSFKNAFVLIPVELIRTRYEYRPLSHGIHALRVEKAHNPELFEKLRMINTRMSNAKILVLEGELANGQGHVELRFVGQRDTARLGGGLYFVQDDRTTYLVKRIHAEGPVDYEEADAEGDVIAIAPTGTVEEEEEVLAMEEEKTSESEEIREETPEMTPGLLELEAKEILSRLKAGPPLFAPTEEALMTELSNWLIGEMGNMRLHVEKDELINWALFTLHHALRTRLDKELGEELGPLAAEQWDRRFSVFRELYQRGARRILESQNALATHRFSDFAINTHDELHPNRLVMRAKAVFSHDPAIRAVARRTSAPTAHDQAELMSTLFLSFARRHVHNALFDIAHEFDQIEEVLHVNDVELLRARLGEVRLDYEKRLAHPRPHGVDLTHPLFQGGQGLADLELEEMEERWRSEEKEFQRHRMLAASREKREMEEQKAEEEEDSPRQRKLPSRTPQGSPTGIDALLARKIQGSITRFIGSPASISSKLPSLAGLIKAQTTAPVQATPVAAKAASPIAAKTSTPVAAKTSSPVAAKTSAPVATKTSTPVVAKTSSPVAAKTSTPICASCKTPDAEARCPACKTPYCNVQCQHKDWNAGHKMICGGF